MSHKLGSVRHDDATTILSRFNCLSPSPCWRRQSRRRASTPQREVIAISAASRRRYGHAFAFDECHHHLRLAFSPMTLPSTTIIERYDTADESDDSRLAVSGHCIQSTSLRSIHRRLYATRQMRRCHFIARQASMKACTFGGYFSPLGQSSFIFSIA